MVADPKVIEFRQRLASVQSDIRRLRLEAFVEYTPIVCGVRLRPMTLPTYTCLLAWNNAFVVGREIGAKDVMQFVWLHHPAFSQFANGKRRRVLRGVDRALSPAFPTFNSVLCFALPLLHRSRSRIVRLFAWLGSKLKVPTATERFSDAVDEIRRIVREAQHDFPCSGDDDKTVPYAFFVFAVSVIHRGYTLDVRHAREMVETLPLKQLMEFVREVLFRSGNDKLLTADEARVWADWLDFKQETAAAPARK